MARLVAVTLPLGIALVTLAGAIAAAQSYPRLHVSALAQRVDRASVAPGDVFHLTIHVHVTPPVERLDELILGSFDDCEIISNETVRTAAADGTDVTERLTLQALAPGEATIGPAYIDALDPAIGKPMRFSSNAVRVHVTGRSALHSVLADAGAALRRLLLALALVAGAAAAVFVLVVLFVRRRRRSIVPASVVPSAPSPSRSDSSVTDPAERLRAAAAAYRRERSQASLDALRIALLERAGVPPGATLADALGARGNDDPNLRAALLAAECAAFGQTAEREAAAEALLAAVQAYLERRPAKAAGWTP